jgi:hypothetical protein
MKLPSQQKLHVAEQQAIRRSRLEDLRSRKHNSMPLFLAKYTLLASAKYFLSHIILALLQEQMRCIKAYWLLRSKG